MGLSLGFFPFDVELALALLLSLRSFPSLDLLLCVRKLIAAAKPGWYGGPDLVRLAHVAPIERQLQIRSIHLATVFGFVLNWRAAAAWDSPQSTTARTIISRPLGVRGAFFWVSRITDVGDISVLGPIRMDNLLKAHN